MNIFDKFYGRLFLVLRRLPVRAWFKGREELEGAKKWTSVGLISLHHMVILYFLISLAELIVKKVFELNKITLTIFMITCMFFNYFYFSNNRFSEIKNNKFNDIVVVFIYLISILLLGSTTYYINGLLRPAGIP